MFWGIEFAAKKLIFACLVREKLGKVGEFYAVNWLATLERFHCNVACARRYNICNVTCVWRYNI